MTQKKGRAAQWLSVLVSLTFLFYAPSAPVQAADTPEDLSLKVFDKSLNIEKELNVFESDFGGVLDFTALDLGGDGVSELAVAAGEQARPQIRLYRDDGSLINEWAPYGVGYEGRVAVAAGDVTGDGHDEIITGPGEGGGPHIRIFDGYGTALFNGGFFATDPSNRLGTEVAVGDVNGDGRNEIIVSYVSGDNNVIAFFRPDGTAVGQAIKRANDGIQEPVKVFAYDINHDGTDEIILGARRGEAPQVTVLSSSGQELLSFYAYAETFLGGLDVAVGRVSGQEVIVTAAGYSGGPHVRFFDLKGNVVIDPKFFAYDTGFRGGLNVAVADNNELMVMPMTTADGMSPEAYGKVIKVDLSEQRLYAYNFGKVEKSFLISSGISKFPSPVGTFHIWRKRPVVRMSWVYGPNDPNNYDLPGVQWAMSFLGPYNLHGTYWHHNFGHPMSHGCINISNANAEWLYNWAPIGTTVIVQP